MEIVGYFVLGCALVFGVLIGYNWGYSTGYHDRVTDEVNAVLRGRINGVNK